MFRIFSDLGQALSTLVPPWALPWVLVAIGAAAVPLWLESVRGKQIKGAIRKMVRASDGERPALAERALSLAGASRGRLIGLVQEALRYGQPALAEQGLARLEAHPRGRQDAAHLRARVEKPGAKFRDPFEASVRIERLIDEGLRVAAEEQLEEALAHFPRDEELLALRARLSQ